MVTIDNKFDIGQEVYIVRKMREKTVCPACDGIGYKIFNDYKFSCRKCYGTGNLHSKNKIYMAYEKDKIDRIKIFMYIENDEMKTVVKYKLKNGTEFVERSLFATREEAEARCKELNEQL